MSEAILVVFSNAIDDLGFEKNQSFIPADTSVSKLLKEVLQRSFYRDRDESERMPMFKQIIPYLIIVSQPDNKILTYKRAGSEKRLTDLYSIGIGGHINPTDSAERKMDVIENSIIREVSEELLGVSPDVFKDSAVCGVLYDDSNDVGKVHLGIVLKKEVNAGDVKNLKLSDEGKELSWKSKDELVKSADKLEGWSRICVENLFK